MTAKSELTSLAKMAPLARATEAAHLMDEHRNAISRLAAARAGALRELRDSGLSVINIAEALGISRQQVHRVLREAGEEDQDGTVDIPGAATRLGISVREVLERIDAGTLPATKVDGKIRLRLADAGRRAG